MSDAVIDRLATGLRAHVDARRRAEEQRAAFVFTERAVPARRGPDPAPIDWRWFVARTLHTVGDPETLRLLDALRDGPVQVAGAAPGVDPAGHGRLALVERIDELAAAGLVARELEHDEVSLAPLGQAMLDLVLEIERRAGAEAS